MASKKQRARIPRPESKPNKRAAIKDWQIALVLFAVVVLTQGFTGNITSFDSIWVVPSALSLLHDGDLDIGEYKPRFEQVNYVGTLCVAGDGSAVLLSSQPKSVQRSCQGQYHYYYPLAVPLLSAPLVWGVEASIQLTSSEEYAAAFMVRNVHEVERFAASIFIGLAAVLVYLLCREDLPWKWAACLSLVFAFATPAWSIGSRALWQHSLSMPLLAASLWLLSASRRRPGLAAWAGLPLMTAFWVRPTNIVSLGLFSLYVAAFYARHLTGYLVGMLPPVLVFGSVNHSIYGSLLSPYSSTHRVSVQMAVGSTFREALVGNLISPARGLFVFSPIFILACLGWKAPGPGRELRWLRLTSIAVCFFHWILLSSFDHWWGGHCFGPRFFSDLSPLLIFLLIPAVERIRAGNLALGVTAILLLGCSTFIHYQGAMSLAALEWNIYPADIDHSAWRVWDWSDPSFLRQFRHQPK